MITCENDALQIELEQTEPAALTAEQLVAAADEALAGGDFAAVRQRLRDAFELAPNEGEIALALGHAELNGGSLSAALDAYSAAASLMPNSPASHASRALALQLLARSSEAAQAAAHAISLDPDQVIALKVRARIHLNASRPELAQQCCLRILTRHGNDRDAKKMLYESLVNSQIPL
ncbi:MAG TPA: hypothetical protein VGO67_17155 [Verrucomicrobiae bacterium]|jgi:tetratricopeptide (TPR) repeat protein